MGYENSIFARKNPEGIWPVLASLESQLGLPSGFCDALLKEDDWSFIIKLNALFEAALTALIVEKLDNSKLTPVISHLQTGSNAGKVALATALELLVDYERRFIYKLSELRNDLVHRIENVKFDLTKYTAGMDGNQKDAFVKAFGLWAGGESKRDFGTLRDYVLAHPKVAMWEASLLLVATMMACITGIRAEREAERLEQVVQMRELELLKKTTLNLESLFRQGEATGETPE